LLGELVLLDLFFAEELTQEDATLEELIS
jgi:hypothetical protein